MKNKEFALIGKYITVYKTLEEKIKKMMNVYLNEEFKNESNIRLHSAIKSIYVIRNKQEQYSFKYTSVLVPKFEIKLKDFYDNYNFSVSDCLAISDLNSELEMQLFLNYYLDLGALKYSVFAVIKKLTDLRHKLAHENNFNTNNLSSYDVDVHSIAFNKTSSNDTLINNIYWIKKIIIPFLNKYEKRPKRNRYIVNGNIFRFEV